jgi:hypothetical protein
MGPVRKVPFHTRRPGENTMYTRVFLAWLLIGVGLSAQTHNQGYIAGSHSGVLLTVDPQGSTKASRIGTGTLYGLTMDVDNRQVVVCHHPDEILQVDPRNGAVLGTLWKGPPLLAVRDVAIDHHGDYYITDAAQNGVLRLTRDGRMLTVRLDSFRMDSPFGGLTVDVHTGDLLLLDVAYDDALLRLSRDGQRLETVGTAFDGQYGFAQHLPSGEIYAGAGGGASGSIQRLRPYRNLAEFFALYPQTAMYALKADRSSALNQRLVGTGANRMGGIWFIDMVTAQAQSFTLFGQSAFEIDFLYGRNLQTVRTAPDQWEVRISFPEAPAKGYLLLASLQGPGPAWMTPDGRALNLGPDSLFFLTLQGEISPCLTGNHGVLNMRGEARAHLDFRSLMSRLNGLRLWMVALALDPAAPAGIQTISDPYLWVAESSL